MGPDFTGAKVALGGTPSKEALCKMVDMAFSRKTAVWVPSPTKP